MKIFSKGPLNLEIIDELLKKLSKKALIGKTCPTTLMTPRRVCI